MGIEDRDYTRESSYTGALGGWGIEYISPVVKWLIAANVIVFVLQIFLTRQMTSAEIQARWDGLPAQSRAQYRQLDRLMEQARREDPLETDLENQPRQKLVEKPASASDGNTPAQSFLDDLPQHRVCVVHEWLELKPGLVVRGQVWRLLTYAFCHDRGDLFHILFNMLFLFWFGVTLESMYGGREFLLFYLAAGIVSGVATLGLDLYLGSNVPAIGASGAVMGVLMLYAIHYPRSTICVFWLIPVEVRLIVILYVLFDLYPVLLALAGDELYTGVAHAGHLGGLAFGFVYWKYNLNLQRYWDLLPKWRVFRSGSGRAPGRATIRLRQSPLDDQVDEILKKLHESGEASLTDQERLVLQRASERYKRKPG